MNEPEYGQEASTFANDDGAFTLPPQPGAVTIARLNDLLRSEMSGGQWLLTSGVDSLREHEPELFAQLVRKIRTFSEFESGNDPYGEHDFGAVEVGSVKVFWKTDYYAVDSEMRSPDPADPAVTRRVMVVMLAEEY